jgi:micrococcal nuclease
VTSGTELRSISTISRYFITFLAVGVTTVACTSSEKPEATELSSSTTLPADSAEGAQRQSTQIRPTDDGLEIEVTRVSDGDSLRATSNQGDLEIRLLGVNAPEREDCFGDESTSQLEELLEGAVTLHPWPGETDQFGRQLGFLVSDGVFVNLSLVESGHVVARAQSNHGFEDEFESAERAASGANLGLWAPDACGLLSDAMLRIVDVEENPPGDDRDNPNGEWVLIENAGDGVVSLARWTLRDESTRHRMEFPDVMVPAGATVRVRTGCGDNALTDDPIEIFWCDPEPPVWNNDGDTAFLLDPNGAIADSYFVAG